MLDWLRNQLLFFAHLVSVPFIKRFAYLSWQSWSPFLHLPSKLTLMTGSCRWNVPRGLKKHIMFFCGLPWFSVPRPLQPLWELLENSTREWGSGGPGHPRGDILEWLNNSCQPSPAGTNQYTCALSSKYWSSGSLCVGVVRAASVLWRVMDAVTNNYWFEFLEQSSYGCMAYLPKETYTVSSTRQSFFEQYFVVVSSQPMHLGILLSRKKLGTLCACPLLDWIKGL